MSQNRSHTYESFARVFSYPWNGEKGEITAALERIAAACPEEAETLSALREFVDEATEQRLQELYTHTFEIHPLCYLDVGYVLFGEDYKRGQFLVHLNREHEKVQNRCGTELADHLPNLLRLLPKLREEGLAAELGRIFVIPAVEKMLPSFKEKGNVYGGALQALSRFLQREFPGELGGLEVPEGAAS
ncbi:MAG: hypothetical protein IT572_04110 [Deltaproteobacteria bacterium]|nr:hypothetical protein [Deltaproteobacteria bacterium]